MTSTVFSTCCSSRVSRHTKLTGKYKMGGTSVLNKPETKSAQARASLNRPCSRFTKIQAMSDRFSGPFSDKKKEAADVAPSVPDLLKFLKKRQKSELDTPTKPGSVHLVGTGPGDPGLLTWRAIQLMQSAEVVLYDRLVSNDILDLVSDRALMVYVGKRSGYHHKTQDETNRLILEYAQAGCTVLRLKGGDPHMFGRGGEEVDFLREAGVRVQVVPGITAAAGVSADLGLPLTQRGIANSTTFLTGHSREGGEDPLEEIAGRADERTTLVIYMGLQSLPKLASRLMHNGTLPGSIPAVAVMKGTTADQVSVFAPLEELPEAVVEAELKSPTLVIIGHVVALSHLFPGTGKRAVYGLSDTPPQIPSVVDQGSAVPESMLSTLETVERLAKERRQRENKETKGDEISL